MHRLNESKIEVVCAAATTVALVPVWIYPWFPTQDGPSHLYNAMLLARWGDPAAVTTSAIFERVLAIFPNWTVFVLLAFFGRVFTPWIALKIVISLCVVAIPAATLYLQKSFKGEADPTALVGVMFGFSFILFMGFFNFVLGSALFAFIVGFRWRRRTTTPIVALYFLLALCYLTHGLAFSATVMALVLLALMERRWSDMLMLIPPIVVVAIDAWPRINGERGYQDFAWHLKRLFALDTFAYFRAVHANIASAMSILMFIAIVMTLRRQRRWIPIALSAMLLVLFFVSPWFYGVGQHSRGSWLNERFLMLFVMTLPAWIDVPHRRIVLALLVILTAIHIATTWRDIARISPDIASIVRCRSAIADHATLDVLGQPPRIVTKLDPLRHAAAYLAVDRDIAYLADYEAELEDFPMRYRDDIRPQPDYVLVWRGATADGAVVCEGTGFRVLRSERQVGVQNGEIEHRP